MSFRFISVSAEMFRFSYVFFRFSWGSFYILFNFMFLICILFLFSCL